MPIRIFSISLSAALAIAVPVVPASAQERGSATFQIVEPVRIQHDVLIPPILEAGDLAALLDVTEAYVIDLRNPQANAALYSYAAGHIPGSVNVPYGMWRELWNDPVNVPTDAALTELVQQAGLTHDLPIVLVHSSASQGNFGSAAFVYWTLKSAGFENMAILNGGVTNWQDNGLTLSTTGTPIERSETVVSLSDEWLATHEDVDAVLNGTSNAQLLDARPIHQIMEQESLEGSYTLNAGELISEQGARAGSDSSIFMRLKQADLDWQYNEVITYCNNGALAAVDWFMASEIAEIPNVRMYAHSLNARQKAQSFLAGLTGN